MSSRAFFPISTGRSTKGAWPRGQIRNRLGIAAEIATHADATAVGVQA